MAPDCPLLGKGGNTMRLWLRKAVIRSAVGFFRPVDPWLFGPADSPGPGSCWEAPGIAGWFNGER